MGGEKLSRTTGSCRLLFLMKEETKTRGEGGRKEEEDRCVKSTLIISFCFSLLLLRFLGVCAGAMRSPLAATPREGRRELWH